MMPDTTEVVQDVLGPGKDLLAEITDDPVFITYKLEWNAKREKYEKVPHNGKHNLSYSNSADCKTFTTALELATGNEHISGIGIVFQGGIIEGDWQLIGLDFDGVENIDTFPLPVRTYAEVSLSGAGIHQYAWAPITWAGKLKNTGSIKLAGCDHAEFYCSTCYLTLTGNQINAEGIARLTADELATLEGWKLNPAEKPLGERPDAPELEVGKAIGLLVLKYSLPDKQRLLLDGKLPVGGRSEPFRGLLLRLMTLGHPDENILATLLENQGLWAYLLSKRDDNPYRAAQFAREEVKRARVKYNEKHPPTPIRAAPADDEPAAVKVAPADDKPATSEPAPAPASAFPVALYDEAPGLVGDIAMWLVHASCAPRVEFAYACALSVMSCLIGPYITFGDDDGKVNLYIALVGGTGSGKTKALGAACKLLSYTDAKDRVQDFPASEAALRRQLNVTPNVLLRVDELAHKIDSFKDSANGSGLSRAVLGMYDGERLPPKQYADDKKTLPAVEDPFVQILGGTTAKIWDVLQTKHLEDGTLNRFIFVSLPEQAPYSSNRRASNKIDKTFKDRLNAFFRQSNRANLIGNQHVSHAPGVQAALEALGPVIYAKQQGPFGELYGRFTLHVEKIAVILAVGDGRMVTSMTDYAQALTFIEWSVANTYATASTELAGSAFEKSTNKVISLLSQNGNKMRLRDLYKQLHRRKTEVEELLLTMEISGIIERTGGETHNTGRETEWVCLLAQNDEE